MWYDDGQSTFMTDDCPPIVSLRMKCPARMGVDLRGDHATAATQFGVEGRHPRWRDMEHVHFSRLKWPIGILDPDRVTIASAQPEHGALAVASASFAQLSECGTNQSRWAAYQHSAGSFLGMSRPLLKLGGGSGEILRDVLL